MAAQYYKINYKSDFVLTINSDAGWAVPFCIKFWTGMPLHGYFAGFDGENYVNCRVGETPTQLLVMFDDHHMPIGPLRMQIAYHTTIEEFPDRKFDEVTNPTNVTVDIDGTEYQVMLDFTGETGADIDFSMPSSGVMSVNGKIGYVTLNAEDVGAQPTIEDLATIRSGAAAGATAVQPAEMTAALATKQDTISDLATIRNGAAAGATAVQPATLQEGLATKQDTISDLATIRSGAAAGATAVQPAALQEGLATKQDVISDLSTIRSGAAAGATAVQPAALTPIESDIDAIEGKIPSAASTSNQLADKAFVNSALADKADTSDIPTALSQLSQDSTHRVVTDAEKSTWNGKQNAISDLATIRSGAAAGATAVQPAAMNTALAAKQDTLTFDNTPTANSNNPVKSSGIKTALDAKQDTISDLVTIRSGATAGSTAIQSLTVGTTTTGAAGTSASVTNTGTATAPVLSFTIPQGAQGIQGIQGPQGERGPQGNTGVQVDSVASIIHSIDSTTTYAADDVAGADAVQDVLAEVTELAGEVDKIDTMTEGINDKIGTDSFNVVDGNGNIGFKVDNNGANANAFNINSPTGNLLGKLSSNGLNIGGNGVIGRNAVFSQKGINLDREKVILIADNNGNVLAKISEDGLVTKNYDSGYFLPKLGFEIDRKEALYFADNNGNVLAKISEDGLVTKNFDSSNITGKTDITVANSDTITILGSSFGETNVFPSNKHWSGIMSLFTDYRIQNHSLSGSNVVTNLNFIRTGTWDIDGRYVLITNGENFNGITKVAYIQALDNLCSTIISMGKEPIIATNYQFNQYFVSALKDYAYKHNYMFFDAATYCNTLIKAIFPAFDDGAHLRRRNAPMVADAYLNHLHLLEEPKQSIKVFRLRDTFISLDDLMFFDNETRAKKFKEITVSSQNNIDEYNKLINNESLSFDRFALLDCVLPVTQSSLKELSITFTKNKSVKVYVKDAFLSPYPDPSSSALVRFSVANSIVVPNSGDTYSCNGVTYTVQSVLIGENGYYCTIYCSPATLPSTTSGTLTKVTGEGESSITFSLAEETTTNLASLISLDNKGHWRELEEDSGSWFVDSTNFETAIQDRKVSFLVENVQDSSTFTLAKIKVSVTGEKKHSARPRKDFVWSENDFNTNTELMEEPTFGNIGTTSSFWKNENGQYITSVGNYEYTESEELYFPTGVSSEYKVSDVHTLNAVISADKLSRFGNLVLEVYCRYFPTAPSPYTQANDTEVNDSSYDYSPLYVKLNYNTSTVQFEEKVGLMWKIVRIPLIWFYQYFQGSTPISAIDLKIYSDSKGLEICKVSLKYTNN